MKTLYSVMQIFVLSYTGIVVLITLFLGYFEMRYGRYTPKAIYKKTKILNKLRGRMTILYPLIILNIIFIICWIALAVPFFDFALGGHHFSHFERRSFVTWFGSFNDLEFTHYFGTVFIGILGAKGSLLISELTSILKDTSLAIGPRGLKYRKDIP
jgi:hypothetical protein